jgi:UDP-N-acetylmuramate dehydrogenase
MTKLKTIKDKIRQLIRDLEPNNIIFDMNTAELTSVKTGGKVLCYLVADTMKDLKKIVKICSDNQIDFMMIGDGTNILFNDKHLDLVLIKLGMAFKYIDFSGGDEISTGAACRLFKMVVSAADRGYDFSELSGIPGTIGGGIAGNCGPRHKGVCDFIKEISYISNEDGNIREKTRILDSDDFGYRHFHIPDLTILTRVVFKAVNRSKRDDVLKKIRDRIKDRKKVQPVNTRNAGCFFKNILGCSESSGELIEKCGLKGFAYGGARVSDKHANFIENFDNASSEDIFVLSNIIKDMVMDKFKVKLEYEVKTIGF